MTAAELSLYLFALFNSVRVLAYVPQIFSIARDQYGASAISYTTWTLFAASHLSTMGYSLVYLGDWRLGAVFGANTACCGLILYLTARKRARFRQEKASMILLRPVRARQWEGCGTNPRQTCLRPIRPIAAPVPCPAPEARA